MKKRWIIWGVIGVVVALVAGVVAWRAWPRDIGENVIERFVLSDEMYGRGEVVEITAQEFDELVAEKKSFVVVLHMVVCPAEFPVTVSAKELAHSEKMVIYSLVEEEFEQTFLAQRVKYLPSVALIREGELVAFLDAESDEDLPYYKTAEGLKEWMEKWIEGVISLSYQCT